MTDSSAAPPVRLALLALRRLYGYEELLAELLATAPDGAADDARFPLAPPADATPAAADVTPSAAAPAAPIGELETILSRALRKVRDLRSRISGGWALKIQADPAAGYPSGAEAVTEAARLLLFRWPSPIGLVDLQRALRVCDVEADEIARHLDGIFLTSTAPPASVVSLGPAPAKQRRAGVAPVGSGKPLGPGGRKIIDAGLLTALDVLARQGLPRRETPEGRAAAAVLAGWHAGQRSALIRPAARAEGIYPSALKRYLIAAAFARATP